MLERIVSTSVSENDAMRSSNFLGGVCTLLTGLARTSSTGNGLGNKTSWSSGFLFGGIVVVVFDNLYIVVDCGWALDCGGDV